MNTDMSGRTALVTGSTSGIGLGIAKVLAQAGAQLVLNGFGDSSHARAEVAALGKIPGYHDADLRDVGQIERAICAVASVRGRNDAALFEVAYAARRETGQFGNNPYFEIHPTPPFCRWRMFV